MSVRELWIFGSHRLKVIKSCKSFRPTIYSFSPNCKTSLILRASLIKVYNNYMNRETQIHNFYLFSKQDQIKIKNFGSLQQVDLKLQLGFL